MIPLRERLADSQVSSESDTITIVPGTSVAASKVARKCRRSSFSSACCRLENKKHKAFRAAKAHAYRSDSAHTSAHGYYAADGKDTV